MKEIKDKDSSIDTWFISYPREEIIVAREQRDKLIARVAELEAWDKAWTKAAVKIAAVVTGATGHNLRDLRILLADLY